MCSFSLQIVWGLSLSLSQLSVSTHSQKKVEHLNPVAKPLGFNDWQPLRLVWENTGLIKPSVVYFGGRSLNLYGVYQDVKNMARCLKMRWVNFISKDTEHKAWWSVKTMSSVRNTREVVGWHVCLVRCKCVEGEVALQVMARGGGEEDKTSQVSGRTRVLLWLCYSNWNYLELMVGKEELRDLLLSSLNLVWGNL